MAILPFVTDTELQAQAFSRVLGFMYENFYGEKGLYEILSLLAGKDPKTIENWSKTEKFDEKISKSVSENTEMPDEIRSFFKSIITDDIDCKSLKKIAPLPLFEITQMSSDFALRKKSTLYQEIASDFAKAYPAGELFNEDDRRLTQAAMVVLTLLCRHDGYNPGIINYMKKSWDYFFPDQQASVNKNSARIHISSCFITLISDYICNSWNIEKGDFYKISTGLNDKENARRTWFRWKEKSKNGTWKYFKKVIKNMSKDERFSEQTIEKLSILAFSINMTFILLLEKYISPSSPHNIEEAILEIITLHKIKTETNNEILFQSRNKISCL
ncbi:hypothetical protein [Oceanobacter kriegii]|uniref:hypothetical protein n=1 Tax=Oceanobacter kriegii TaxID=64972 RepID=UPI0003FEC953|nr:hypothetical protein [Oceanobacter kriegii]